APDAAALEPLRAASRHVLLLGRGVAEDAGLATHLSPGRPDGVTDDAGRRGRAVDDAAVLEHLDPGRVGAHLDRAHRVAEHAGLATGGDPSGPADAPDRARRGA